MSGLKLKKVPQLEEKKMFSFFDCFMYDCRMIQQV